MTVRTEGQQGPRTSRGKRKGKTRRGVIGGLIAVLLVDLEGKEHHLWPAMLNQNRSNTSSMWKCLGIDALDA
jgi:hypothetical protein